MKTLDRLREKANSLPTSPGVYIMKDSAGEVIYVGKSKKLKNRVVSYFVGRTHTPKTARMVSLVSDFDYIVCKTEIEALTLENVLIKKHSPKYNIKLKDAKSYPYIKVTQEEFPKLTVTRERKGERGRYFGPYQSSKAAYSALDTVMKIFSLASCKRSFPRDIGKDRPCIYRDIGRCIAPCAGGISSEEYRELVRAAERVLGGDVKETEAHIKAEMERASEELEFERAAKLRDSMLFLSKLSEKQKVVCAEHVDRDVFALYTSEVEGVLAVLSIRRGALINKNEFILSRCELTSPEDALPLIVDYYDASGVIPHEIMLDFPLEDEDRELLSEYLSIDAGRKVYIKIPERGDGRALCDMALENAREAARQNRLEGEREDKNLKRLTELLGLCELPRRIEAYDISNLGGENIVASMVVYADGKLKRSDYRLFNIKTEGGPDDYASMRDVLKRRLLHIGDGTASLGEEPDLILLDGGEAHVHTVREVMDEIGVTLPLFGMVKDDFHKTRAITDGTREISIAQEMGVYALVFKIQEEVHRFAISAMKRQKTRSLTKSSLEKIPGIGEKKAKILLRNMPLAKIRNAKVAELSAISGISERDAENIAEYFKKAKESGTRVKNNNRNR